MGYFLRFLKERIKTRPPGCVHQSLLPVKNDLRFQERADVIPPKFSPTIHCRTD
jgi:hypothetical protein